MHSSPMPVEHVADLERHLRALDDRRRLAGVEVEDAPSSVSRCRRRAPSARGSRGRPCSPPTRAPAIESSSQYPMAPPRSPGPMRSSRPSPGGATGSASRRRTRPRPRSGKRFRVMPRSGDVGQHHRRDAGVVVDDLGLGEPHLGVQDLVEVADLEPLAVDARRAGAVTRSAAASSLGGRLLAGDLLAATSVPGAAAVGWRPRASLAAATRASSAAMRSTTLSSAAARAWRSRPPRRRPCAR